MSKEERPVTEPRWALIMVPWKDENHALDGITVQIMWDYAHTKGFDERRCRLYGLPQEVWSKIPDHHMLLEQLGTNDERPTYSHKDLVEAYEKRRTPDERAQSLYVDTPGPTSDAYELYKVRFEFVEAEIGRLVESVREIRKVVLRMGRNPDAP